MRQEKMGVPTPEKMVNKEIQEGIDEAEAKLDEELSAEILEKLKNVDFHQYLYEQCKSAAGRGLGVEEEDLLTKGELTLPLHWEVNGQKAQTIGRKAGAAANDRDLYYSVKASEVADKKTNIFKVRHTSSSGNTDIEFTIEYNPETEDLLITDIDGYKSSSNTSAAIDRIESKEESEE